MKTLSWKSWITAAGLAVLSQFAAADPIGPDCPTCNGGIYTLSYDGTALADTDAAHETFRITLNIDTSGVGGVGGVVPTATAIDAVAIKVASSIFDATLFSAPDGTASWALVPGGISAIGCDGSGSGFECADWIASGPGTAIGGTLDWIFDVTMDNGALFTLADEASIKARYVDSSGAKVGDLVSEAITLQNSSSSTSGGTSGSSSTSGGTSGTVPEPNSSGLVFLGLGAVLASFLMRRRASGTH